MTNLWSLNTPQRFWCCLDQISENQWLFAIENATPILGLTQHPGDCDSLLMAILGEGQFGINHWDISSTKRLFYFLKPYLPRTITRKMRKLYSHPAQASFPLNWPLEDRYVNFQWRVIKNILEYNGEVQFIHFWPNFHQFAFVLTHDIETEEGQTWVRKVVQLEEGLGFKSSFNFVPEKYPVDIELIEELRERGFEIGIHGLKHDGKLFNSREEFGRRTKAINRYLDEFNAVGFRAPLTQRQPEWMQDLEIEYDLSFFDTDPFEPIPGGTMSIWPFKLGRFIELPYTLVQDYTLTAVLGEKTPKIWLDKVEFIKKHHGMVLVNTHPDYLSDSTAWQVYSDFLHGIKKSGNYWNALPKEVARWWRNRSQTASLSTLPGSVNATVRLEKDEINISVGY